MASSPDQPPEDGAARISQAVADYAAVGQQLRDGEAGGGAQEVTAPIPVYGLGMPDPDSDPTTLLSRTQRVAWRYLVLNGSGPSVADLQTYASHPVLNEEAGLADRIIAAGRVAEERVGNDPAYELRLLDLSMLGHSYLWAASGDENKPDRIFTLDDQPAEANVPDVLERASTAERQKGLAFATGTDDSGG